MTRTPFTKLDIALVAVAVVALGYLAQPTRADGECFDDLADVQALCDNAPSTPPDCSGYSVSACESKMVFSRIVGGKNSQGESWGWKCRSLANNNTNCVRDVNPKGIAVTSLCAQAFQCTLDSSNVECLSIHSPDDDVYASFFWTIACSP